MRTTLVAVALVSWLGIPDLSAPLWRLLEPLWPAWSSAVPEGASRQKAGCGMDPSGQPGTAPAGCGMDPDGLTAPGDEGCGMDPDGLCGSGS